MNKTAKRVLLLVAVVCMMFALFTAVAEEAPECGHNWKMVTVLQAGDCKEEAKGVYKDQCTLCNAVRYESRIEHTYVARFVDATCTEAQMIREICSVCGVANKNDAGTLVSGGKPALGHDYEVVYVAAGCENNAGTQQICKRCDKKEAIVEYPESSELYVEKLGHDYKEVKVAATCVTPGKEGLSVCSRCGGKLGKEVATAIDPVNGHKAKVSAVLDAGECDEPLSGIRSLVCEHCGKDMGYEAFTPEHDLDILKVIVAGNCGVDGKYSVACKNCEYKNEAYVVAATKKHNVQKVELKATCTEPAYIGSMCVVCGGEKKLEKVVGSTALGHTIETVYIKDENCLYYADTIIEKCTKCDLEPVTIQGGVKPEDKQHKYEAVKDIEVTCSTPGLYGKEVCSVCGDVKPGTVMEADKTSHENEIVTVLKPVDCSLEGDAGNGIGKSACKYCGGNVQYVSIPNTHTWVCNEVVKAATCAKPGVQKQTCSVCGKYDANGVIEATGKHNYVETAVAATCEDKAYVADICTGCKAEKNKEYVPGSEVLAHNYVKTYIEKDICNYPAGLLMTCSMCEKQIYLEEKDGAVVEVETWTKAHVGTIVKLTDVAPTCVADGLKNKTMCDACGEIVYKGDVDPKDTTKHDWEVTVLKAVTCKSASTEKGYNMLTCKLCKEVAYEEVDPATAHNFVEVKTVAATCLKEGKIEYKCSICEKATKEEVIPATGKHDYQEVAYQADCENPAKAGKICVICKIGELNVLEGSKALGHKWADEKVVSATCYNPAGVMKTCSACAKQVVTKLDGTEVDLKDYAAHTVVVKAEAATCSTKGYEGKEICSVCQKVLKEGTELEIVKTNHKNVLSVVLKAADCTKGEVDGKGIGKYACEYCGEFGYYGEITIDKAHDIKETVTKPATCGEAGKKTVACTKCSYTEEKEIEKLKAHTIEEVSIPASCEDVAYVGTMCVVCKGEKNLMKVAGSKELGHKWTETVVEKATCYTPAGVMKSCSTCGTKLVDTLDGNVVNLKGYKNHTSKDVEDIPATCTTTGWEGKKICSVCNEVLEEGKIVEIDKTAHKNGIVEILKEADCLNGVPGIAKIGCEYCGTLAANPYRSITEADTAVYHKLVVSSIKDKDCGNNGEKVTVCSVCGDKFVEVLPMTNEHKYVSTFMDADCEKAARYGKQCSVCGAETELTYVEGSVALGHDWLETVQAQTCEHGFGVYKICKVCGEEAFVETDATKPALNHMKDGVSQIVAADIEATCHSEGISGRFVCKLCNEEFGDVTVVKPDPAKHAPVLDEVITAATCKVPGTARYVCKYGCEGWYTEKIYTVECEYTEEKIDATGTLVFVECKSCGEVIVKKDFANTCAHTFVAVKGYAATEEADGLTAGKKCSKCPVVLYGCQKIPMIVCDHVNTEVLEGKAATCTEKGLTEGKKCNDCGLTLVEQEEIPALAEGGHTEVVLEAKAATCKETGLTEGKKCSVCEAIIVAQEEVEKLAHTEVVIEAKAATCTEAGLTEGKKCSVCEEIIVAQEEVKALGHTEVVLEAKAATCTEAGLTEGKKCSVCEEILVAQEAVEALGHTKVALEGKAATCTEAGLTAGEKCSVCDAVLVAQEEIAALGHKYSVSWDFNADFTKKLKIFTCEVCGDTYTEEVDF